MLEGVLSVHLTLQEIAKPSTKWLHFCVSDPYQHSVTSALILAILMWYSEMSCGLV